MPEGLLEQVLSILLPALATLIAGWFTILGTKIKNVYTEKVNTQTKKEVVELTVAYVQQLYSALDGEAKLQKAIEQASLILAEKGITVSEVELRTLIESAVYGLKQGMTTTALLTEGTIEEQKETKGEE